MFNNFKVSLASGIKIETPNSIFTLISYHYTKSFPNSPFTSDKHSGLDVEFLFCEMLPSYDYRMAEKNFGHIISGKQISNT